MALVNSCLVYDSWMADILKRDVFRVTGDLSTGEAPDELEDALKKSPVFLYSKIPVESVDGMKFLQQKHFHLIDTNVVFEKESSLTAPLDSPCEMREALASEESQVVALARQTFTQTRFHLDPQISLEQANNIKAEWARSFFKGKRGNQMIVAIQDEKVCGFLQLIYGEGDVLIVDLIGVDASHRRKNIARNMILYAESSCGALQADGKFKKVRVGTQIANIPSIRLYEGLGFKCASAQYVFHITIK